MYNYNRFSCDTLVIDKMLIIEAEVRGHTDEICVNEIISRGPMLYKIYRTANKETTG